MLAQKIVDENINIAFIMEDDIFFDKKFWNFFKNLEKNEKIPYDYLLCNYHIYDKNQRKIFMEILKKE